MVTIVEAFQKNPVHLIASILIIVGGLNWLFVGLFNRDLVSEFVGPDYSKYVFDLVGIAALYKAVNFTIWVTGMKGVALPTATH